MKVSKFNPLFPGRMPIGSLVDDFFNRGFSDVISTDFVLSRPSVNIAEGDEAFQIEVAAPGLEKTDFDIKLEGDILTISAQKQQNTEEQKDQYTRREFNFSSFTRSFQLPKEIDSTSIKASYEKGVLHVQLPKLQKEVAKPYKQIEIM